MYTKFINSAFRKLENTVMFIRFKRLGRKIRIASGAAADSGNSMVLFWRSG